MNTELSPFITTELAKFEIKEEDLRTFVSDFAELKIDGVDDRDGYKKVYDARQSLKKKRVEIANKGKELRASANAFAKAVITRENELIAIIDPVEKALLAKEDLIDAEKKRLRDEEKKKEDNRIQEMLTKLAVVGYAVDFTQLRAMTEEQFTLLLEEATHQFSQAEKAKKEEEAAEVERKRLADLARKTEDDRLAKIRADQQAEQARLDTQKREQEERERKIRAENERLENEKKAILKQRFDARFNACASAGLVCELDEEAFSYKAVLSEQTVYFPYTDLLAWTDQEFSQNLAVADSIVKHEKAIAARQKEIDNLRASRQSILSQYEVMFAGQGQVDFGIISEEEFQGIKDTIAKEDAKLKHDRAETLRLIREEEAKAEEKEKLNQASDQEKFSILSVQIQGQIENFPWDGFLTEKATLRARAVRDLLDRAKVMCNNQ